MVDIGEQVIMNMKIQKTKIKMNGKLSGELIVEMLDSSDLGVWIGPINVSVLCCADDVLTMTDNQEKLQ